ncbi:MAG: hypothetical protein ACK4XJ_08665 [Fimbriimonadaceae bacterium]
MIAVFVCLAPALVQEPTVTYRTPAIYVKQLVKELSPMVGRPLSVDATLANAAVLVAVEDQPPQTVLDKIAWAVGAQWQPQGQGLVLRRTSEFERADLEAERKHIVDGLKSEAARMAREALEKSAASDREVRDHLALAKRIVAAERRDRQASTAFSELNEAFAVRTPAGRALHQMLRHLDWDKIGALDTGRGFVMSPNPTRVQTPMTPPMREAVVEAAATQPSYLALLKSDLPYTITQEVADLKVTNALLFVRMSYRLRGLASVYLELYLLNGFSVVGSAELTISSEKPTTHGVDCSCVAIEKMPFYGEAALSPESKAFKELRDKAEREEDAFFPANAFRVDQRPFATLFQSDALLTYAEKEHVNLVVAFATSDVSYSSLLDPDTDLRNHVYGTIESERSERSSDWVVAGPRFPVYDSRHALEPALYQALMGLEGQTLNLDQRIQIERQLIGKQRPSLNFEDDVYEDETGSWMYLLYDNLSLAIRNQLATGGRRVISQLGENVARFLRDELFYSGTYRALDSTEPTHEEDISEDDADETAWEHEAREYQLASNLGLSSFGMDMSDEATLALPNGLPADAFMTMTIEESLLLTPAAEGQSNLKRWERYPVTLDEIAWAIALEDKESISGYSKMSFLIGQQRNMDLIFHLTPQYSYSASLQDSATNPNQSPVTLQTLPAPIKRDLDKLVEEFKRDGISSRRF